MEHTILLVQNDSEERFRVSLAFASAAPQLRLCTAADGAEAVAYLSGTGKYRNRHEYPVPQLIVLDIDAANQSGFEIVHWLRANALHLNIPFIGITSGADKSIIDRAYELGASSCVLKSKDESAFLEIATGIADYAALLKNRAGATFPAHALQSPAAGGH
jgi:CheY-like chemotaxis protein